MLGGLCGGLLGGAIGAGLWVAFAVLTGQESGWIAAIVGVLAGCGAAMGARGARGRGKGLAWRAAAIAIVACLAAKYITVRQVVLKRVAADAGRLANIGEADAQQSLADEVLAEFQTQGRSLTWTAGFGPGPASAYPDAVRDEAARRWERLPPQERARRVELCRIAFRAELRAREGLLRPAGFAGAIGLPGAAWIVMAAGLAWHVGAARGCPRRCTLGPGGARGAT